MGGFLPLPALPAREAHKATQRAERAHAHLSGPAGYGGEANLPAPHVEPVMGHPLGTGPQRDAPVGPKFRAALAQALAFSAIGRLRSMRLRSRAVLSCNAHAPTDRMIYACNAHAPKITQILLTSWAPHRACHGRAARKAGRHGHARRAASWVILIQAPRLHEPDALTRQHPTPHLRTCPGAPPERRAATGMRRGQHKDAMLN